MIFLDIDGVLHGFHEAVQHFRAGPLSALRRIVVSTDARIVLSSSWRSSPESVQKVNQALASVGLPPVIDATPLKGFRCVRSWH